MEKVTITKISKKELQGKNGPFTKLGIQTVEYGERWFGDFLNRFNANWKVGDVVEIEWEEVFKDNKTYFNLIKPDPLKELTKRVERLEQFMTKGSVPVIEKEVKEEDLPF